MLLLAEKILSLFLILILSLTFGFLPLFLSRKYDFSSIDTMQPLLMKKNKKNPKNVTMSFLLNLGGGALLANCFCHWLPEVREGLEGVDTFLPLAEVITLCGFFFISGVEELLHHFLHPHRTEQSESQENLTYGTSREIDEEDYKEKEHEKSAGEVKAAIRLFFVVFALSFHSIIEGFALSIEDDSSGVWMNTVAISLHKFVIAFSVGVELISNKASLLEYTISTLVFACAGALGSAIGIILSEFAFESANIDLPLQILQGIATGTILYVVFTEIFPKAKLVGGTGSQHILAMVLGFAIFLPSLYFHGAEHDHGHGSEECPDADMLQSCLAKIDI